MEKVLLPIKTKIAAWWMIVIGAVCIIICIIICIKRILIHVIRVIPAPYGESGGPSMALQFIPIFILLGFSFLCPGFLILKRKKWAWWLAVVILFIVTTIGIYIFPIESYFSYRRGIYPEQYTPETIIRESLFIIIIFLLPFILLLLDRKNFWKVAV